MSWQDKVKESIAAQCLAAYEQANKGKRRHVAYRVPDLAAAMVAALNSDDETEGKRLLFIGRIGAESLI